MKNHMKILAVAAAMSLAVGAYILADQPAPAADDLQTLGAPWNKDYTVTAGDPWSCPEIKPTIGDNPKIRKTPNMPDWITITTTKRGLILNFNPPVTSAGSYNFDIDFTMTGSVSTEYYLLHVALTVLPPTKVLNITYNANGGSGTMAPSSAVALNMITVSGNGFTPPTHYAFAGWNTQADGLGQWYAAGSKFYIISDLTLYARWVYVSPPTAAFTSSQNGLTVNFTNTSVLADSYLWDFGDGSTKSTEKNPSHTYAAAGKYTVTLKVTGVGGNDEIPIPVNVALGLVSAPKASFKASISGTSAKFTYTGSDPVIFFAWDFGDGKKSTERDPTNIFPGPGTYNVVLTVTNDGGSSNAYAGITIIESGGGGGGGGEEPAKERTDIVGWIADNFDIALFVAIVSAMSIFIITRFII